MKVQTKRGIVEVDSCFFLNPEETLGDLYAVSIPFGNFSRTFILRAREYEIVTVLLGSKYGDSIKVDARDIVTSTEDFLIERGNSTELVASLRRDNGLDKFVGDNELSDELYEYFENSCDYALDSDLNVWYHSDLIMKDCVERVELVEEL